MEKKTLLSRSLYPSRVKETKRTDIIKHKFHVLGGDSAMGKMAEQEERLGRQGGCDFK